MALRNDTGNDRVATKTVWLLFAVALNALEFFIPRIPFFPWLKPGFANIITIIWIIEFGAVDAVLYSLLRVWVVGFFFGFSLLTMSLAMCGGVLSTVAMSLLWAGLGKKRMLGTVGLGVCGALFHNLGQIVAVYGLMTSNPRLFLQIPIMLIASVIFGGFVGLLVPLCRDALLASGQFGQATAVHGRPAFSATRSDYVFSLLLLAGCCAIVFTDSLWYPLRKRVRRGSRGPDPAKRFALRIFCPPDLVLAALRLYRMYQPLLFLRDRAGSVSACHSRRRGPYRPAMAPAVDVDRGVVFILSFQVPRGHVLCPEELVSPSPVDARCRRAGARIFSRDRQRQQGEGEKSPWLVFHPPVSEYSEAGRPAAQRRPAGRCSKLDGRVIRDRSEAA